MDDNKLDYYNFVISEENDEFEDIRVDKFIAELIPNVSRSYLQKLIKDQQLLVNQKEVKANYKLKLLDQVELTIPKAVELNIEPEDITLDILYEDEDVIVVNKPKGMVVHPAAGHYNGTLVNALLFHCSEGL